MFGKQNALCLEKKTPYVWKTKRLMFGKQNALCLHNKTPYVWKRKRFMFVLVFIFGNLIGWR